MLASLDAVSLSTSAIWLRAAEEAPDALLLPGVGRQDARGGVEGHFWMPPPAIASLRASPTGLAGICERGAEPSGSISYWRPTPVPEITPTVA